MTATRTDLLATIRELEPVLAELAANKDVWADNLDKLSALATALDDAIPGDYLDVDVNLRLALGELIGGTPGTGGSGGTGGTGGGTGKPLCLPLVCPGPDVSGTPGGSGTSGGPVGGLLGGLRGGNG